MKLTHKRDGPKWIVTATHTHRDGAKSFGESPPCWSLLEAQRQAKERCKQAVSDRRRATG